MLKKVIMGLTFSGVLCSSVFGADCAELVTKYEAPDPASKTMQQIKRWVSRKIKDNAADAQALENCLIAKAADNPNKEQVAGK